MSMAAAGTLHYVLLAVTGQLRAAAIAGGRFRLLFMPAVCILAAADSAPSRADRALEDAPGIVPMENPVRFQHVRFF